MLNRTTIHNRCRAFVIIYILLVVDNERGNSAEGSERPGGVMKRSSDDDYDGVYFVIET
jgi:hypothetical protein